MLPKAFIFDVDGTLADTERDGHRIAFNRAFAEDGLDWDWNVELYGELLAVTGGKERMTFYLDQYRPDFKRPTDFKGFLQKLHNSKNKHYAQLLETGSISLRPGVERLLIEARENGIRLAVATTTTPENVTALLRFALKEPILDWFEVIAAGDVVPAKKPAPDIYWLAMRELNLKPHECLAFEDSENGIKASLGAKLSTIITVNEYTQNHDFSGALLVVNHLGDPGTPCRVLSEHPKGIKLVNLPAISSIFK